MSIEGQGHFFTIYFPDFVCFVPRYQVSVYRIIGPLVSVGFKVERKLPFLAHLSRKLISELIGYSWSAVRSSSSVRRRSQCSKISFSETAGPIKAKFYVEPPWVGGTIFCSRHLGHMTKMAATPIYGKNPSKILFSRTGGPIFTNLGM